MKTIKATALTILTASLSVLLLAIVTGLFKPIPKNGFNRKILTQLQAIHQIEKPEQLLTYIGKYHNRYYFSGKKVNKLFSYGTNLNGLKEYTLDIPYNQKWQNNFAHAINGDSIYSWAAQVPAIYSFAINGTHTLTTTKLPYTFTRAQQIGGRNYLLRSFDPTDSVFEQVFIKYNAATGSMIKNTSVTEHLNDGGMLTDGMLLFDSSSLTALYIYFFANQLIWLDTNLNIIRRGHTIDTFATVTGSIEIYQKGSGKRATFNAPPKIVNLYSQLSGGYLFNLSAKQEDNETKERFNGGNKIDIYKFSNGQYVGSLKIPSINKEQFESFAIVDGQLLAIYKSYLVSYPLAELLLSGKEER
ncbi:hypothetical protein [Pedobacter sp.]